MVPPAARGPERDPSAPSGHLFSGGIPGHGVVAMTFRWES